jgi:cell division protease FtsH
MVCELGMSEAVGPLSFGEAAWDNGPTRYSEEESRLIGSEIRRIVEDAYQLAYRVLRDSREMLDRVVVALLERETLSAQELDVIARLAPGRREPAW